MVRTLTYGCSGATDASPITRYAYNALGQRVFKTEPQYPSLTSSASALQSFFTKPWSPATAPADVLGFGYVYDEQGAFIGEYRAGGAKSVGSKQYLYLPKAIRSGCKEDGIGSGR